MPLLRTTAAACWLLTVLTSRSASAVDSTIQPPVRIVERGSVTLPQAATDRDGHEVPITGLSGISWLGGDRYAAIMDNSDRLILFSLALARDGTPQEPADIEVVTLAERHDYEDVAVCPESLQKRISARQRRKGLPDPGRCLLVCEEDTPAIRVVSLDDGSLVARIPVPEIYATRRPNRGFEALDIDPDGRHLWTANEEALPADGPASTAHAGTVVRIARIAIPEPGEHDQGQPIQIAYAVDPPHQFVRVFSGDPLSGIAAITGLGDGTLLVLERAGCPGLPPFENRLYLVDTRNAADVSHVDRDLAVRTDDHVTKALLWKDQLGCNVEGLCLGPSLSSGERSLLAIADNNGIGTPSVVVAFTVTQETRGSMGLYGALILGACVVIGAMIYRVIR